MTASVGARLAETVAPGRPTPCAPLHRLAKLNGSRDSSKLCSDRPQNQVMYVPKSAGKRKHFASIWPIVQEHFLGMEHFKTEKSFWDSIKVLGEQTRGVRYHRNPSRQNSAVERDPSKGSTARPAYYLDACMLDAYGSAADEMVIRRRLKDNQV